MDCSRHLSTLLLAVFFSATLCTGESPKYSLLTDAANCSFTHGMKDNDTSGILSMLEGVDITECSFEVNSPVDGKNSNAEYVGHFRIKDISVLIIDTMNETDVQITVKRTDLTTRNILLVLITLLQLPLFVTFIAFIKRKKN